MVENIYFTSFLAPTPPQMFQITSVMTTSLSFSWQVPRTLNGNLTGYQLFCQPLRPGIPPSQMLTPGPTAVMTMLSGLYPGVGYNCSIVARNSAGPSDPAYTNGTTLQTGTSVYVVCIHYLVLYVTNLIPMLSPCVNQTLKGKWPCMMLFNCHHAALAALLLVICAHMEIIGFAICNKASTAFPYFKRWKAGRGLGTKPVCY